MIPIKAKIISDRNKDRENNLKIRESLADLILISQKLDCFIRIFGSVVYVALRGEFYRKIGDIDSFVDFKFKEDIAVGLEKKGYVRLTVRDDNIPRILHFLGFRPVNFVKDSVKLSLFFVFRDESYAEIPLRFGLSFRIPRNLISRNYKIDGLEFYGLSPEAALFTLPFVRDKTKRKIDFDVLFPFCRQDIMEKIKNSDTLFLFGRRIPLISRILAWQIKRLLPH